MPTTDDYLAAIDAKRQKGDTAKVDFSQLPQGVDGGKIASALSQGLPDEYSKEIQNRFQSKSKVSLNYSIVKPSSGGIKGAASNVMKALTSPIPGLAQVGESADKGAQNLADKMSPSSNQIVDIAEKTGKIPYGKIAENVGAHTAATFISGMIPRTPLDVGLMAVGTGAAKEVVPLGTQAVETGESVLRMLGEGKTIGEAAKALGVPEEFARDAINSMSKSKAPLTEAAQAIKGAIATKEGLDLIANPKKAEGYFHGSGTKGLTIEKLDPNQTNHESLFGQGIYLTDNPDVAEGYAKSRGRKTGSPIIYRADVKPEKVLSMDAPLSEDFKKILFDQIKSVYKRYSYGAPSGDIQTIERGFKEGRFKTNADLYRKFMEMISSLSHEHEISSSEFVEDFQELNDRIKKAGYEALSYKGGLRAGLGKVPEHNVLVLLDKKNLRSFEPMPSDPINTSNHELVSKAVSGDPASKVTVMKQAYEKYMSHLKQVVGPAGELLGFKLDGSQASSTAHNLFDRRFGDIGTGLFEAGLFRRDAVRGLNTLEKQAIPFVIEGKIPQLDRFVHPQAKDILDLAKDPTPAMKEAIAKIGPYLKEGHSFLKDTFDDVGFKENYISHLWERGGGELFGPGKQTLSKYNPFTKGRFIGSYAEGINMGLNPKTLDVEQILEHYDNFKVRSVANAKFAQSLKDLDAVKSIEKAPADWVRVEHPALARKQFIPGKDGEPGFFMLRPVAVHPDFAPAVQAIISKPFSNEGVRAMEMFNAAYKKSLFSFSLFHHFTLGTIDMAAGGNPFKIMGRTFSKRLEEAGMGEENPFKFIFGKDGAMNAKKIYQSFRDGHAAYDNIPLSKDAISHGLNVNPLSDAQVGKVRQGIISMEQAVKNIPVVGTAAKVFRTYDELFDKGLWSYWHAGVKLDLYERHLAQNLEKFPNMPIEEVKRQTAEFVNNAAGGALDGMMISPKFQQTLHWLLIAPDFLLTRLNSFASMFKGGPVGYQARKMWLKAAVGYYTAANVMNYVNTKKAYGKGQYMWENDSEHQLTPFLGRVENGPGKGRQQFEKLDKAFTEPLEIIMHPKKVLGNKFSPYLNAMAQFWTGRTMSGYKPPEDVTPKTYLKQMIPMTFRGASEYGVFPKVAGMSQTEISTRLADAIQKKDKKSISFLVDLAKKNGYNGEHIHNQVRRILVDEKKKEKVVAPQ